MGLFGRSITKEEEKKLAEYDNLKVMCEKYKDDFGRKWQEANDWMKKFQNLELACKDHIKKYDDVWTECQGIKDRITDGTASGKLLPSQTRYIYGRTINDEYLCNFPKELKQLMDEEFEKRAVVYPVAKDVQFGELEPKDIFVYENFRYMKVEGISLRNDNSVNAIALQKVSPIIGSCMVIRRGMKVGDHCYFHYKTLVKPEESCIAVAEGNSWKIV